MIFEVGVVLEDDSQWQAPAHCFLDDTAEMINEEDHVRISSGMEGAKLLRKFAEAAAF